MRKKERKRKREKREEKKKGGERKRKKKERKKEKEPVSEVLLVKINNPLHDFFDHIGNLEFFVSFNQ